MHSVRGGIRRKIKIGVLLLSGLFLCGLTGVLCYSSAAADDVVINEVCSNNFSLICDENGNYADYVELYNPAPVPVSLTGFSLSDNKNDFNKCSLDSVVIPAKGYQLIWMDGTDSDTIGHASFKISSRGERIYLSNDKGVIIDSVEIPELAYNTVFARVGDGGSAWGKQISTAGMANEQEQVLPDIKLEKPELSIKSGFYEEAFWLEMRADQDEVIYYTLDGSEPTVDSMRYEEPLRITDASQNDNVYSARSDLTAKMEYIPTFKVDKATVVRAIAASLDGSEVSEIATETYFVGFDGKQEYEGYPILSLVTDPVHLFDGATGIYGNGNALEAYDAAAGLVDGEVPGSYVDEEGGVHYRYMSTNAYYSGKEWERNVCLIFFDEERKERLNQEAGIRISGQSTRNAAQKSFNVYARDIYDGQEVLGYEFFEGMEYSSIKIRNGGTDHPKSKIYDPFLQSLAEERDVSIQASRPCVVFLNGEYWGIYNIRERYKEDYFRNHYGIGENNIWMIDSGADSIGGWDAWNDYNDMICFISENDMTDPGNYQKASELVDLQSLIDFYCIHLYIDNNDMAFDKNMALWRSIRVGEGEYEDGRWRFMLYDLDGALDGFDNNTFVDSEWWKEDFSLMDEGIISSLLKNQDFRKQFTDTFIEIADTTFDYNTVHEELMRWKEQYEVQVIKSHQRFISSEIGTEEYDSYIEHIDKFFKERRGFIIPCLEEEMRKY
ncbi:MAG: CotH kinase family protein [Lachnospiraceae bacterium]|nr:CotH kinase family protein [Lachnospiraceae bacterium]